MVIIFVYFKALEIPLVLQEESIQCVCVNI